MDEQALGKRLQLARKRSGLTQQELCQKAGLSYSTLAKIERGAIKAPSVFTVSAIAVATGTPLEEILNIATVSSSSPEPDAKKRSKTGVRFVYFDVNHVLVRYFEHAFTDAARDLGVSADLVETLFWRYNDSLCSGEMTLDIFNQTVSKELGSSGFDWQRYYFRNVETMPGAVELIDWVGQYFDIGLLSNSSPGFLNELLEKKIIPPADYKVVVDSSKVGAVKPEPKIYQVAQDLASLEPNELLLVDDTRPFLTAADKLGWQVQWFDELKPDESVEKVKKQLEF